MKNMTCHVGYCHVIFLFSFFNILFLFFKAWIPNTEGTPWFLCSLFAFN